MTQTAGDDKTQGDECVSRKPWSEVLNRSLKLFVFNAAGEGGRSVGKVVFFVFLGLLALGFAGYLLNSVTGIFEGWFDFWPFGGAEPEEDGGWFSFGSKDASDAVAPAADPEDEPGRWYCKWNPIC